MNEDLIKLARRAVASPHFRWMPKMQIDLAWLDSPGARRVIAATSDSSEGLPITRDGYGRMGTWPVAYPDLTDSATLGCLHDLACAALGADVIDIRADVAPDMSGHPRAWWTARELRGRRVASGRVDSLPLRAAGYVAALEAATEAER